MQIYGWRQEQNFYACLRNDIFGQAFYNNCLRRLKTIMEESKKRKLEEKLRELLMYAKQTSSKKQQVEIRLSGTKVIRRRKGSPDIQILQGV
jgi:hypothetical protein